MDKQYLGILVLVALAAIIAAALSAVCLLLGPRKTTPYKSSAYECGVGPIGDAHERFPIKFYLVAIVFILFDIEVVFLWSWFSVFNKAQTDTQFMLVSFVEFLGYMATWIVGYLYAIKVGAIDWDETQALAPEKLGLEVKPVEEPEIVVQGAA